MCDQTEFTCTQSHLAKPKMDLSSSNMNSKLLETKINDLESSFEASKDNHNNDVNHFKNIVKTNSKNVTDLYDLSLDVKIELTQRMLMLNGKYYYTDNISKYPIYAINTKNVNNNNNSYSFDHKQHWHSAAHSMKHETYVLNNKYSKHIISNNLESLVNNNNLNVSNNNSIGVSFDLSKLNKFESETNLQEREEIKVEYIIKGHILLNDKCLQFSNEFKQCIEKLLDKENSYYNWNNIVTDFGEYFIDQAWIGQKTWISSRFAGTVNQHATKKQLRLVYCDNVTLLCHPPRSAAVKNDNYTIFVILKQLIVRKKLATAMQISI